MPGDGQGTPDGWMTPSGGPVIRHDPPSSTLWSRRDVMRCGRRRRLRLICDEVGNVVIDLARLIRHQILNHQKCMDHIGKMHMFHANILLAEPGNKGEIFIAQRIKSAAEQQGRRKNSGDRTIKR